MSSALYATRLLWNGRLGLAKHSGVIADLTAWPPSLVLPGVTRVSEMDYIPEVRKYEVRPSGQGWRRMDLAEKQLVAAFLQRVSAAANLEIERTPA